MYLNLYLCTMYLQNLCTMYLQNFCTMYLQNLCTMYLQNFCTMYLQNFRTMYLQNLCTMHFQNLCTMYLQKGQTSFAFLPSGLFLNLICRFKKPLYQQRMTRTDLDSTYQSTIYRIAKNLFSRIFGTMVRPALEHKK